MGETKRVSNVAGEEDVLGDQDNETTTDEGALLHILYRSDDESSRFKEENGHLPQVKVDEVLRLVGHVPEKEGILVGKRPFP